MKAFTSRLVLAGLLLATICSPFAYASNSLERFSPRFSSNTDIIWQAPTNNLPPTFWVYKRLPSTPFSELVISNAVTLASLQDKGFPKPSTNDFFIWGPPNPCGMSFSIFSIQPSSTTIDFGSPNQSFSTNNMPDDETVTKRAYECAAQFGLAQVDLIPRNVYSSSNAYGRDGTLTQGVCGRGVLLSRKLDGIGFLGIANQDADGFSIELGSGGHIRAFSLVWPSLEAQKKSVTASPSEIIACVRAQRVLVLPNPDEERYFERLKALATAKRITITKITPCYGGDNFGEVPTNNIISPNYYIPLADMEAVADFGDGQTTFRMLSPLLSSEVRRFIGDQ